MRSRDFFWLGAGIAVGFAIGAAFPRLRREFGPLVSEATARGSEMASMVAATVAEQIERMQNSGTDPTNSPPSESAVS